MSQTISFHRTFHKFVHSYIKVTFSPPMVLTLYLECHKTPHPSKSISLPELLYSNILHVIVTFFNVYIILPINNALSVSSVTFQETKYFITPVGLLIMVVPVIRLSNNQLEILAFLKPMFITYTLLVVVVGGDLLRLPLFHAPRSQSIFFIVKAIYIINHKRLQVCNCVIT